MSKIVMILLLLFTACKKKGGTPITLNWEGIPIGKPTTCAWSGGNAHRRDNTATCIVEGRAYLCVADWDRGHIACALVTPPIQPEAPVSK